SPCNGGAGPSPDARECSWKPSFKSKNAGRCKRWRTEWAWGDAAVAPARAHGCWTLDVSRRPRYWPMPRPGDVWDKRERRRLQRARLRKAGARHESEMKQAAALIE